MIQKFLARQTNRFKFTLGCHTFPKHKACAWHGAHLRAWSIGPGPGRVHMADFRPNRALRDAPPRVAENRNIDRRDGVVKDLTAIRWLKQVPASLREPHPACTCLRLNLSPHYLKTSDKDGNMGSLRDVSPSQGLLQSAIEKPLRGRNVSQTSHIPVFV